MMEVPDAIYNRVFQQDGDGAAILQELSTLFFDPLSFDAENPHKTSFNEGRRSVIQYIMQRAAQ